MAGELAKYGLSETLSELQEPKRPGVGKVYMKLARSYADQGNYKMALVFNTKALQFRVNKYGEESRQVAEASYYMGTTSLYMGQRKSAMIYYERALDVYRKAPYCQAGRPHALTLL